jgi:putative peptidoglycan lipid II flippase
VAIKVLAPGYYASQDMRTPMRIAIVVLVITQLLNSPWCRAAARGLALSIGIGALVNALWLLLAGLLRRGSYKPSPGWGVFALQVFAASALLAVFLLWAAGCRELDRPGASHSLRVGAGWRCWIGSALFISALWVAGLKLRQFHAALRRFFQTRWLDAFWPVHYKVA